MRNALRKSTVAAVAALACAAALPVAVHAQEAAAPPPAAPTTPAPIVRLVTLDGVRALRARAVVAAAARAALGKPGDRETLAAATRAVNNLYRERGFPVAQVVTAEVTPDGTLRLGIVEGRVRRIVVRGNKRTRTATILEAIGTRAGDAYNEFSVRDDRNRLARLGLFNDVTVTAQVPGAVDEPLPGSEPASPNVPPASGADPATAPPPAAGGAGAKSGAPTGSVGETAPAAGGGVVTAVPPPPGPPGPPEAGTLSEDEDRVGDVDLVVRVSERQTANIAATVGYTDVVGPVGFLDLSELNLGGTAQRVGLQWQRTSNAFVNTAGDVQRGDSRQAFSLSYERPALGLRSTAFSVDVYDQNTVFLPFFAGVNFTIRTFEIRQGATVRVGRALTRRVTGYVTARHDKVGYDFAGLRQQYEADPGNTTPFPSLSVQDQAQGRVGALGVVLVGDGRDAADNPRRGYLSTLTLEDSNRLLGGNSLFRQATLDLRGYAPLRALPRDPRAAREAKDVPVFATRIMAGASSGTVPLPEQYFLGGYELLRGYEMFSIYGDRMLLGMAELRAPVSPGVQGVAFIDAGNAWLPGGGSRGIKAGFGAGLRFASPIGPIRFDAAYGDRFRTYVSLGQSF